MPVRETESESDREFWIARASEASGREQTVHQCGGEIGEREREREGEAQRMPVLITFGASAAASFDPNGATPAARYAVNTFAIRSDSHLNKAPTEHTPLHRPPTPPLSHFALPGCNISAKKSRATFLFGALITSFFSSPATLDVSVI